MQLTTVTMIYDLGFRPNYIRYSLTYPNPKPSSSSNCHWSVLINRKHSPRIYGYMFYYYAFKTYLLVCKRWYFKDSLITFPNGLCLGSKVCGFLTFIIVFNNVQLLPNEAAVVRAIVFTSSPESLGNPFMELLLHYALWTSDFCFCLPNWAIRVANISAFGTTVWSANWYSFGSTIKQTI